MLLAHDIFSDPCIGLRYKNALNPRLFPSHISFSSLLLHITYVSHYDPAFAGQLIFLLGHCPLPASSLESQEDHRLLC